MFAFLFSCKTAAAFLLRFHSFLPFLLLLLSSCQSVLCKFPHTFTCAVLRLFTMRFLLLFCLCCLMMPCFQHLQSGKVALTANAAYGNVDAVAIAVAGGCWCCYYFSCSITNKCDHIQPATCQLQRAPAAAKWQMWHSWMKT